MYRMALGKKHSWTLFCINRFKLEQFSWIIDIDFGILHGDFILKSCSLIIRPSPHFCCSFVDYFSFKDFLYFKDNSRVLSTDSYLCFYCLISDSLFLVIQNSHHIFCSCLLRFILCSRLCMCSQKV